jgi:hypothetical protein
MALLESPGISTLPSNPKIDSKIESIKGPSGLNGLNPTVTIKDDLDSEHSATAEFKLEEHPIDKLRPVKVGIVGAGLTGITAGVLLPEKLPGLDLRIYDKNADVVCDSEFIKSYNTPTNFITREAHGDCYTFSRYIITVINYSIIGLRTPIPVSDAIYPPTPTNPASRQIRSGQKSLPKVPKSEITGRELHASIMCTSIFEPSNKYKGQNGWKRKGNGRSPLHILMAQKR